MYFLFSMMLNFPPNGHISWEWGYQIPHFLPGMVIYGSDSKEIEERLFSELTFWYKIIL